MIKSKFKKGDIVRYCGDAEYYMQNGKISKGDILTVSCIESSEIYEDLYGFVEDGDGHAHWRKAEENFELVHRDIEAEGNYLIEKIKNIINEK